MKRSALQVTRRPFRFQSDQGRVITRLFVAGDPPRIRRIVDRVAGLADDEAERLLGEVLADFSSRHRDIESILLGHFHDVSARIGEMPSLGRDKQLLIGGYFTMEYSVESAALFNPSIVLAPELDGTRPGHARFVLSFRATGEGHVSSLEFRKGSVNEYNELILETVCPHLETPKLARSMYYEKNLFGLQLIEMSAPREARSPFLTQFLQRNDVVSELLDRLTPSFTLEDLHRAEQAVRETGQFDGDLLDQTFEQVNWLAQSNYEVRFEADTCISERVLFPVSDNERRGIEDARFTRFVDGDQAVYYATYTAYDGEKVRSQLLETRDFLRFRVSTLSGQYANSKGMALFPRKVGGKFAMISRVDGENLFLMYSDDIRFWHHAEMFQRPQHPWEFVQIGNCGSPIETEHGWLLLTHGVGPMRKYCIGASLLDRDDPTKVLGRLDEPILSPSEDEREGYVPNVVYTCGSLIHNGELIIPYATSDTSSRIATVPVRDLFDALLKR